MSEWRVCNKKADFIRMSEQHGIDKVIAKLIRNRDIMEDEEIALFLHGSMNDLHDPHQMKDADRLVEILADKIQKKESIRIIGDYDIDGVMSTYIFQAALHRCGAKVSSKIPDRLKDGYGLNVSLVEQALADGVDTILTCDNGIAAIEEIAFAKDNGMTVLVTDHHEVPFDEMDGEKIYRSSRADAIVNPHQSDCAYPYKYLCGAAVVWKIVCLLYEKLGIPASEAEEFLENVAFATVGDIVDLTGENRILVKEGIKSIHHTKNIGMSALIQSCGLESEQVAEYHFGFVLGPCINASGRLDTATRALELLLEQNPIKAAQIANELVVLNEERKDMTKEGEELAIQAYKEHGYEKDAVIVIYLPEVHESIAGIIAGRIKERYYKPTFILTKAEQGAKGSGRSIEEYSMFEQMSKCKELFTKFGGHPMAAGLSLPEENIDIFRQKMNEYCPPECKHVEEKIYIDIVMPLEYASKSLVQQLRLLAPFGKANAKPIFADKGLQVKEMRILGKNKNVLRMDVKTERGSVQQVICFRNVEKFLEDVQEKFGIAAVEAAFEGRKNPIVFSMIYHPSINTYNGIEQMQYELKEYLL